MNGNNISVLEAAKLMGKSPQFIRIGLQRKILPIGYAVQNEKGHYSYYISPKLFYEQTGIMYHLNNSNEKNKKCYKVVLKIRYWEIWIKSKNGYTIRLLSKKYL